MKYEHTNAMRALQDPLAGYENFVGFARNGIKIVIAYYTFSNKASYQTRPNLFEALQFKGCIL